MSGVVMERTEGRLTYGRWTECLTLENNWRGPGRRTCHRYRSGNTHERLSIDDLDPSHGLMTMIYGGHALALQCTAQVQSL